jgi:hypothetical protein
MSSIFELSENQINMLSLEDLIKKVDELWVYNKKNRKYGVYSYTIGKFPQYWCFGVTNSWQKWMDKKYEHQFYAYTIEGCIINFLLYVKKNKINVSKLMDK